MNLPTLGVIGGGQLGRMLGLAAVPLGLDVEFLEKSTDVPAAAVGLVTVGWPSSPEELADWASDLDVVTYELEGVPAGPLDELAASGVDVRPGAAALRAAQDRVAEKETFAAVDIPCAAYRVADTVPALHEAVSALGSVVVKTRTGGFDGRGQAVVRGLADADGLAAAETLVSQGVVVEELLGFEAEVSVVGARGVDGLTAVYPLVHNEHRGGILRVSRVPSGFDDVLGALATDYLRRLLDHLDYVGVLTLELFVVGGRLLANEMAPRVHNSGHWTIEGAETSQFEQHVRAVCGLPLGSAALRGPCAMVNLIGGIPSASDVLAVPGTHLHLYGKEPRPGRKVGHVTVTAPTVDALEERLAAVVSLAESSGA